MKAPTPNSWLLEKAEILNKYAQKLPHKLDRIKLKFDYPECGWLHVHVLKNDAEIGVIYFSDVYDTFVPLIEWLEHLATISQYRASAVNLNCEDVHHVFDYQPIWFYDGEPDNSYDRYPLECGIFTWYEEVNHRFSLDAYCNTYQFIKDIYESIIGFAKEMREKPNFLEDWDCSPFLPEGWEYDEEDPRMLDLFINRMTSPKIEKYLY